MKKQLLTLVFGLSALAGNAQLQNLDFEYWDSPVTSSYNSNSPTGWTWTNGASILSPWLFYSPPSTVSQSGQYALTLNVWYNYTKDAALQTAAINSRPTALNGYYKYTDNLVLGNNNQMVNDTAEVSVYLTKWNTAFSRNDTVGAGKISLNAIQSFTPFRVNINYSSNVTPDSITVFLDPSLVRRGVASGAYIVIGTGVGSYFTVDNLTLESGNLSVPTLSPNDRIKIFPNPSTDIIHFSDFTGIVTIAAMNGTIIRSQTVTQQQSLSIQDLPAGIYMLTLNDGKTIQHSKVVKN